jgi:hypothetical protein
LVARQCDRNCDIAVLFSPNTEGWSRQHVCIGSWPNYALYYALSLQRMDKIATNLERIIG